MQVISDLLKPERQNLVIREDRKRGVFVDGLSEWVVRTPAEVRTLGSELCHEPLRSQVYHVQCWKRVQDAYLSKLGVSGEVINTDSRSKAQVNPDSASLWQVYGLMERGAAQRATGATKLNEMSSRSHAVFIIIVEKSVILNDGQAAAADEEELEQFRGLMPGGEVLLLRVCRCRLLCSGLYCRQTFLPRCAKYLVSTGCIEHMSLQCILLQRLVCCSPWLC